MDISWPWKFLNLVADRWSGEFPDAVIMDNLSYNTTYLSKNKLIIKLYVPATNGKSTNGNGQMPCWLPPFGACPLSF